jgi:hypothetical protein
LGDGNPSCVQTMINVREEALDPSPAKRDFQRNKPLIKPAREPEILILAASVGRA